MRKENTVSVIVPCYNAEKYLGDTVSSILSQTRLPNEIVFVNDGSTDNTKYMLDVYQSLEIVSEKKIKISIYDNEENRGIGYTRQKGIDVADGDYVSFLSSDDVWHPLFLEKSMDVLNAIGDIRIGTYVDYYRCNAQLEPFKIFRCPEYSKANVIDWALNKNMFINFSGIVFDRMLPVMFETNLKRGEDLIFLLDSLIDGYQWYRINEPLLYYRVIGGKFDLNKWLILWEYNKNRLNKLGVDNELIEKCFISSHKKIKYVKYEKLMVSYWIKKMLALSKGNE